MRKWVAELTGRTDLQDISDLQTFDELNDAILDYVETCYKEKSDKLSDDIMQELACQIMLRVIDTRWMSYLQEMDYLKTGIGLRGFGQRDPLVEYKTEAFAAFTELVNTMYEDFLRTILRIELRGMPEQEEQSSLSRATYSGPADVDGDHGAKHFKQQDNPHGQDKPATYRKDENDPYASVGRNDPCPCGSGIKFKNCHGRSAR